LGILLLEGEEKEEERKSQFEAEAKRAKNSTFAN